jgi:hypothetical protein
MVPGADPFPLAMAISIFPRSPRCIVKHRYRCFRVHVGEPEIEKPLRRQDRQEVDVFRGLPGEDVHDAPSHQEDLVQVRLQDSREGLYLCRHQCRWYRGQ